MKFLRDSFRDFLTISGFFLRLRDFCGIFTGFLRDSYGILLDMRPVPSS